MAIYVGVAIYEKHHPPSITRTCLTLWLHLIKTEEHDKEHDRKKQPRHRVPADLPPRVCEKAQKQRKTTRIPPQTTHIEKNAIKQKT